MARLPRVLYKLFGSTGPTDDFATFGSQTAGAPVKTKDISTIQSLEAWDKGLKNAIVAANRAPFLEDVNSIEYVHGYMLAYLLQEGVGEWNGNTEYHLNSIVKKTGTYELYVSLTNSNTGNALPVQTDDANWKFVFPVRTSQLVGSILNAQIDSVATTKLTGQVTSDQIAALAYSKLTGVPEVAIVGYRRPVLVYDSITRINLEVNSSTANTTEVVFPDGSKRSVTEDLSSTEKYRAFRITRTANFVTGVESGGLRSGLSEAANTWYAIYAVKSQVNTANFVCVGDTTFPTQANVATLDGRYGANSWLYLGTVRNGSGLGVADSDLVQFTQTGNRMRFQNHTYDSASPGTGIIMASGNGTANNFIYTYAAGASGQTIPDHLAMVEFNVSAYKSSGSGTKVFLYGTGLVGCYARSNDGYLFANVMKPASNGAHVIGEATALIEGKVYLCGWVDPVLVGVNNRI